MVQHDVFYNGHKPLPQNRTKAASPLWECSLDSFASFSIYVGLGNVTYAVREP